MGRFIQIKNLELKIERLQAQLDYLKKMDDLEARQQADIDQTKKQ
jgi:uncharacterized coiled-coil protein SlyX